MLSYRESIIATAERHGWHVHEEDGALVVTDGHSTVRHILNGYASGEYYARKHYEDPHWCEVRAYEEEARRNREREEYASAFYRADHREREEVR